MKAQPDYSIYLVTDDGCLQGRTLIDCVREALEGGVTLVQYRAKTASSAEMYAEALQLKALCDSFNVPLIINDRLDIAMAVGAAGVHLGQDDLPCAAARKILGEDYLIGVSAHNPAEAKAALQNGADYLGCGAVFGTASMIDGMVCRIEEELGEEASVIATGGLAQFVTPLCKREILLDKDLLLKGLNIIYKKNKK